MLAAAAQAIMLGAPEHMLGQAETQVGAIEFAQLNQNDDNTPYDNDVPRRFRIRRETHDPNDDNTPYDNDVPSVFRIVGGSSTNDEPEHETNDDNTPYDNDIPPYFRLRRD